MNDTTLLEELPYNFLHKPLLFADGAMEYYGIRKRGTDYDFLISPDDFFMLYSNHQQRCQKNSLGDEYIPLGTYEFYANFAGLPYEQLARNAIKRESHLIISLSYLFFTTFALSEYD